MAATTPVMHPGEPWNQKSPRYFGKSLGSTNSLNLIRLVLAASVLVFHSFPLTGRAALTPPVGAQTIGDLAVGGFFAISGYLITASRQRTGFANFLLLRVGRIYPAFLTVLVVTVCFFAPLAQWINHGSLSGYFTTHPTPFGYVYGNLFLNINVYQIGDTLSSVPYPNVWNGSLWTLYFEFLCYIFIGLLLIWKRAGTSVWPVAVAFAISTTMYVFPDHVVGAVDGDGSIRQLAMLMPYFLGGALIRLLKPYIGLNWIAGVLSLTVMAIGVYAGPVWIAQALAPLYAYGLLWLSTMIPQPKWIARHDVSYGIYIYAFPVQQMLAVLGLYTLNVFWFSTLALAITGLFALASWFWIERPALRRTRKATGRSADR